MTPQQSLKFITVFRLNSKGSDFLSGYFSYGKLSTCLTAKFHTQTVVVHLKIEIQTHRKI